MTLPSEGLIFQNFEAYPPKKGVWYSDHLEGTTLSPSPKAAFRGTLGLHVQARDASGNPRIIVPLNPENSARRIRELGAHRLRFMLRSRHRGVVRAVIRDADNTTFTTPWTKFHRSDQEHLKALRPTPHITQAWAGLWQHIELPTLEDSTQLLTEQGEAATPRPPLRPHQLDFRFHPSVDTIDLHIDEVILDIGHLLDPKPHVLERVQNHWPNPDLPQHGWHFSPIEDWQASSPALFRRGLGGVPQLRLPPSPPSQKPLLTLHPNGTPLHLGTHQDVVGLRFTLRSTGSIDHHLKLNFREEKIRSGTKDERESFSTLLPLDFRGRRRFDVPLNFIGLPLREEFRRHNKRIDGRLQLDNIEVWQHTNSSEEVVVEILEVEQWRRGAALSNGPIRSTLKDFQPLLSQGRRVYNMNTSPFRSDFDLGEGTAGLECWVKPEAALKGRLGLALAFDKMSSRPSAALHFHRRALPPPLNQRLGPHQMELLLDSKHKGQMRYLVRDLRGEIYASKPIRFLKGQHQLRFPPLKERSTRYEAWEHKKGQLTFPVFAEGLWVQLQGRQAQVHIDDIAIHGPLSSLDVRPYGIKPYRRVEDLNDPHLHGIFTSLQGWVPSKTLGVAHGRRDVLGQVERAREKYRAAEEQLAQLRKLDPISPLELHAYFKPSDRVAQIALAPEVIHHRVDPEGLALTVKWPEQRVPKAWTTWGAQELHLDRILPLSSQPLVLPIEERKLKGLRLRIEGTAHPDTQLEISFRDPDNHRFRCTIPLELEGPRVHDLAFSPLHFDATTPRGTRLDWELPPKTLRWERVLLRHLPIEGNHEGEQTLILHPPEFIVDSRPQD